MATKLSGIIQTAFNQRYNTNVTMPPGLYTNDEVRSKFIELLKSSDLNKTYLAAVIKLVDSKTIVPANVIQETWFGKLRNVIFGRDVSATTDEHIMAFFHGGHNRIFIILTNIDKRSKLNVNEMVNIVIHELQHMTCYNYPKEFYNIHKNTLDQFYELFWSEFLKLPKKDKKKRQEVASVVQSLINDLETSKNLTISSFWNVVKKINTKLNPSNDEETTKRYKVLSYLIYSIVVTGTYVNELKKGDNNARYLYYTLYKSYKKMNINSGDSILGQEVAYPSEVICIQSELGLNPNHLKLIPKLANKHGTII